MKFTQDTPNADYVFGHYGDGKLIVNTEVHESSLIIFPDKLVSNWPVQSVDDLAPEHFSDISARNPEIILLGTGVKQRFPSIDTRKELIAAGLNLQFMDTGAACRTYNLLVSEGRDVAAAVILY